MAIDHMMTVAKLRELLQDPRLRPDDLLWPNEVNNLTVFRDNDTVAMIDFGFEEEVYWFDE